MTQAVRSRTTTNRSVPVPAAAPSPAGRLLCTPEEIAALPEHYAMFADGTCMLPKFKNGEQLVFSTKDPIRPGDCVAIWWRPGHEVEGRQCSLKRLVMNIPSFVKFPFVDHPNSNISPLLMFETLNPRRSYTVACSAILAVHKCLGVHNK